MNDIKISACIITYNQEKFIRQCIEGAIKQIVDCNYEIIIGDDCSTDNTYSICEEFAKKYPLLIKLEKRDNNIGMNRNWKKTINSCSGKYIALCEGDDYWTDSSKLQKQVDFLEKNLNYVLCFHEVEILKQDGKIVSDYITNIPDDYQNIETLAEFGNYIHTPSVVYRNIIKDFPFEFDKVPMVDFFLYMMLAEHGKLKKLNYSMSIYRHGVGVFSGSSEIKLMKSNLKLFICLLSYLKDDKIKKIIFERQQSTLIEFERLLNNQYKNAFVSHNKIFKAIKIIKVNYNNPIKILKKVYSKFNFFM